MANRPAALAAYRDLLRAVNKTFSGDAFALQKMYSETRAQFEANKGVQGEAEAQQRIADAHEARNFILESIVQAKKTSCGSFEVAGKNAGRMNKPQDPE
mmetsp:Transcript_10165/g.30664  ORF Transcript_10165/g.30664 Transcript_10165/m.30664 type:complete len:99 (+) Transcript_10165:373-669(+)